MKSKQGFSQLPHGLHKHLFELTGAQLKVWLCHRCCEGKEGVSYPSLAKIAEYTGLDVTTVKRARRTLREIGWSVTVGKTESRHGHFAVPVEHTVVPGLQNAPSTQVQNAPTDAGAFTADGECTPEVDPLVLKYPHVRSKPNTSTAGDSEKIQSKNKSKAPAQATPLAESRPCCGEHKPDSVCSCHVCYVPRVYQCPETMRILKPESVEV